MRTKVFKSIEEIKKYYNNTANTYEFIENGEMLNIELSFDLKVSSNIRANDIMVYNIYANDINANDIRANDIKANNIIANDIIANDISYYALCIAYNSLKCTSIEGERRNSIHKCLDNEIVFKKKQN